MAVFTPVFRLFRRTVEGELFSWLWDSNGGTTTYCAFVLFVGAFPFGTFFGFGVFSLAARQGESGPPQKADPRPDKITREAAEVKRG